MRRDTLFTIAPDAPFLPLLAERVLDGTLLGGWARQGPFWLSDVTIFLPTRRARQALAAAFARRLGGATLLPDIRTFGEEDAEAEPFLPPFDAPAGKRPAGRLERLLTLARLVAAWAATPDGRAVLATPPNSAEILNLANSLGTVIDDLTIEGVAPAVLKTLPPEALAANWQETLQFLTIALEAWPALLAADGAADAAELRNERLRRQAAAAPLLFGERPVIAAGSTGSIPATAELLAAIGALPRGAVVLPGLDNTLSQAAHQRLLEPERAPHGHPQYGLARLLRRLGRSPSEAIELAPPASPRLRALRQALALAEDTADWARARAELDKVLSSAVEGLAIIAARTAEEEARAIAIAARAALSRGESVGVVSPDQTLSRRIVAELQRFDVAVDDAAGTPLFQAAAGRLARQALAVASGGWAPVDLMALLQNRAVLLGRSREETARAAGLIELGLLRGQRPKPGIAGLLQALQRQRDGTMERPILRLSAEQAALIEDVLAALARALAPLEAQCGQKQLRLGSFAGALAEAVAALGAGPEARALPGEREFTAWAAELAEGDALGPALPNRGLDQVLMALMAGVTVTSPLPQREDIAIWGLLEARLQNPDLLILAGLNEDVWPAPADPGPWLSRGMRLAAGLEPPERQQGLAAHDFEMALGNGRVILAYAERMGTAPALPSRLVQRLTAFLGRDWSRSLIARGRDFVMAARRLDAVAGTPQPAGRPAPCPPAALRPRALSITEIETLFRSPYDIYARHVLRLRKLPALGEDPAARERGAMIHAVFARFVSEGQDCMAPEAGERLLAMAREAFAGLEAIGERRDIWLKRFEAAAAQFLAFERGRPGVRRHAEIAGRWALQLGEPFMLNGRADRIDILPDGRLEIMDFKTGTLPAPRQMQAFEAPQLLLEAAMARAGAFSPVPPAATGALRYIKIGLGPEAFVDTMFRTGGGMDFDAAAQEAARRMQRHVEAFLMRGDLPMAAAIRPLAGKRYPGDYDHLARMDEWSIAEGEEP